MPDSEEIDLPQNPEIESLRLQLDQAQRRIQILEERLRISQEQSQEKDIDQMTGLLNRNAATRPAETTFAEHKRSGLPVTAAIIDVDFFKRFNDKNGHGQGDQELGRVGEAIRQSLHRASDLAARWGGEEFVLVLPGTDLEGAIKVALAIQANYANNQADTPEFGRRTMTIGIVDLTEPSIKTLEQGIAEADKALYDGKPVRKRDQLLLEEGKITEADIKGHVVIRKDGQNFLVGEDGQIKHVPLDSQKLDPYRSIR